MIQLLVLCLSFFGLFLVSLAISYALAWFLRRRRVIAPMDGANLKISCGERLYRSRFLGVTEDGWAFQPPMDTGVPVPLRIGDALKVEAACPGGALHFRSILVWRSNEPFMMVMKPPSEVSLRERRSSPRVRMQEEVAMVLDGAHSALVDIGEWGARLATDAFVRKGERVSLHGPVLGSPVAGHVLDIAPAQGRPFSREVRLVFEEPAVLSVRGR